MRMWVFVKFLVIGYIAFTVMIFFIQRSLMYHPVKIIADPVTYGLPLMREDFITSKDGTRIQIWHEPAKPGYPTIVYFHGNAGHIGERAAKFSSFTGNGFGVLALSYRGFGKSDGSPSEEGLYNDARATIDYAIDVLKIPQNKLIYFGESLGSGVAVQMAAERPPGLLVLEAAYTSVETRSAELYPFLIGVRHMVIDKYDSLAKIKNVHAPLLMLHGEQDTTIPIRHGRELFAAAGGPKEMVTYKDVHHADYTNEQITEPLVKMAKKLGLITG
jgi:fermentation-respiration switch protein FrsA (DUF1100 family)